MKFIKIILIATALTAFFPKSIIPTPAQTSTQRSVIFKLVRDNLGNLVAINNLTIDNQRYNVKFIYGTFSEIFKSNNPTFWQNQQSAKRALESINNALNARKISTQIGLIPRKYQSSKFAGSGNSFMIPVSGERTVRQYGEQRTENLYLNGVLGSFDEKQKTWSNYSFDTFSLTPDTPFMYVQIQKL
jgi:hypothetical protein